MNKFNSFIEKRNFKKIFVIWLICAVVAGLACVGALCYVFRSNLSFAFDMSKLKDTFKENESTNVQSQIDSVAQSSDVVDILLLDENNNVTYSSADTKLAWDTTFDLQKESEDSKYLVSPKNSNVVFRYMSKDNLFASLFTDGDGEIEHEHEDDSFYEKDFSNKKVYGLTYIANKKTGERIFVITDVKAVQGADISVKIVACIISMLSGLYWIIVALWVYQNAEKSKMNAALWGIITLITNLAGVLVYAIFKQSNVTCDGCGALQSKAHMFCTKCGKKLGESCSECGALIRKNDEYCSKCGKKVER